MANYRISNPPNNLTMLDVKANLDAFGGPAKQCRFAVKIVPTGSQNVLNQLGYGSFIRDLTLLCEATELPGRGFDIAEVRYYGPSFQMPQNTKYNNDMPMTFICRTGSYERQFFDDWLECINPTNSFDFNYPESYRCQIHVYQLAEAGDQRVIAGGGTPTAGKAVYAWTLQQAWPQLVNPQPVTWSDTDILRLQVTFAYRYWSRPNRDLAPVTQGILQQ